jgi:hypothetical protein
MRLAMRRKLSNCDSQHCNASRVKHRQTPCADACAPHAPFTSSHAIALFSEQATILKTDIESWLSKHPERPSTPPPDVQEQERKRAMSTTTVSHRNSSPKRPRIEDTDDVGPEQSASQLGSDPLALKPTNTFDSAQSQTSLAFKRPPSRSSSTRSQSESPRKLAAIKEDQLSSFTPCVEFAVLDQAQRYKVHIPESLLSLVKQFEVCTFSQQVLFHPLNLLVFVYHLTHHA